MGSSPRTINTGPSELHIMGICFLLYEHVIIINFNVFRDLTIVDNFEISHLYYTNQGRLLIDRYLSHVVKGGNNKNLFKNIEGDKNTCEAKGIGNIA